MTICCVDAPDPMMNGVLSMCAWAILSMEAWRLQLDIGGEKKEEREDMKHLEVALQRGYHGILWDTQPKRSTGRTESGERCFNGKRSLLHG